MAFFKEMNIYVSLILAGLFGLSSSYFMYKLIIVFREVTDLIDKGTPIDLTGIAIMGGLTIWRLMTYVLLLGFQLTQKRVVELLYG